MLKKLTKDVEKYGIHIAGILEIRCKGSGVLDTGKHEALRSRIAADSRCSTFYNKYLRLGL
jgi:hypothetical protein